MILIDLSRDIHVDAPRHFNTDANAKPIDQVPLENFFTGRVP